MMICKLLNVGNTIAVSVPAAYRRQLNWKRGDRVALQLVENDEQQPVAMRIWSVESGIHEPEIQPNQIRLAKKRIP
jgi:bifunctional DNA-binding transcriptional regulator/antitoxin component of YhaV-PrlF toxin-antitoxin module